MTPDDVSRYLRLAVRRFRKRYGHPPPPRWESIPRAGIHALWRHTLKCWPPKGKRMVGILSLGDVTRSAPSDLLSEIVKSVSAHHH